MTDTKRARTHRKIRNLLDAASHLNAAISSLEETGLIKVALASEMGRLNLLRSELVRRAKNVATSVDPSFWEDWRPTFDALEVL